MKLEFKFYFKSGKEMYVETDGDWPDQLHPNKPIMFINTQTKKNTWINLNHVEIIEYKEAKK